MNPTDTKNMHPVHSLWLGIFLCNTDTPWGNDEGELCESIRSFLCLEPGPLGCGPGACLSGGGQRPWRVKHQPGPTVWTLTSHLSLC